MSTYFLSKIYRIFKACWAAGWGVTELNKLSSNLLSVGLNHLPLDYCLDKSHYFASQIASDNFCAGLPDFDGDGETDPGLKFLEQKK